MVDGPSPEGIEKRTNNKNDKEQQPTIEIRDNDEQQTTLEISDNGVTEKDTAEQVHDIVSITGFAHGGNIKQG